MDLEDSRVCAGWLDTEVQYFPVDWCAHAGCDEEPALVCPERAPYAPRAGSWRGARHRMPSASNHRVRG